MMTAEVAGPSFTGAPMSAVRDEHLLVFAAGTVVRVELDKNQVRAGDGHGRAETPGVPRCARRRRGEVFSQCNSPV